MVHPATGTRTPAIAAQGWSKDFGQGRGILDLDLEVRRGEVFGFIGPNGSGKSTTIRSLLGLLKPTAGRARVLGLDPHRHGSELRAQIGYLPGELSLWENRTGGTFLQDMSDLRGGLDGERQAVLVERLGADLGTKIRRLSKGNKQKLGLVQAFMHDPDLLILDEPTDGLDPLLRREVHGLILEAKARGATVFLSSHVIHEVEQVCDRVALVRAGRLLLSQTLLELRANLEEQWIVEFAQPVPPAAFQGIEGVARVWSRGPRQYRFLLEGSPAALVKLIANFEVASCRTSTQELEDALLYLYEDEKVAALEGA